jgi:hypothetical protein
VFELTRDEILEAVEAGAQKRLGLSVQQFVRAHMRGELSEPGRVADLVALVWLLSDDDPVFAAARR